MVLKKVNNRILYICAIILVILIVSFFIDTYILGAVSKFRNSLFDYFFLVIEYLSSSLVIVLFVMLLYLYKKEKRRWVIPVILSSILTFCISLLLKIIIRRPRPFYSAIINVNIISFDLIKSNLGGLLNYSFPSFETMLVFAMIPILAKEYKRFKTYYFIFAVLVALSMVYFGLNYLSDVLFGAVLGYIIGYLIVKLEERHRWGKRMFQRFE